MLKFIIVFSLVSHFKVYVMCGKKVEYRHMDKGT